MPNQDKLQSLGRVVAEFNTEEITERLGELSDQVANAEWHNHDGAALILTLPRDAKEYISALASAIKLLEITLSPAKED